MVPFRVSRRKCRMRRFFKLISSLLYKCRQVLRPIRRSERKGALAGVELIADRSAWTSDPKRLLVAREAQRLGFNTECFGIHEPATQGRR